MFSKFIKDIKKVNLKTGANITEVKRDKLLIVNNNNIACANLHNIYVLCKKHNYNVCEIRTSMLNITDFYLHSNIFLKWIYNFHDDTKYGVIIVSSDGENPTITDIIDNLLYKRKINKRKFNSKFSFIDYI